MRLLGIDVAERNIPFRMPFRFGVVTLEACPQLVVRARVAVDEGREVPGVSSELALPKWFDKSPTLTEEDNVVQLRRSLAIAAEVYSERFYSPVDPDVIRFFPVPVTNVACFVACAVAAILLRRRAAAHKRLIYLATSNLLVAAFFRWWADGLNAALPPGLATEWLANFVGVALLLAAAVAYDLASRGTVHRVYRVAIPLILAAQLTSVLIGQSDWWPAVGRNLLGIA